MDNKKAVKIRIEFDDGTVFSADGPHAAEIYDWYETLESYGHAHGLDYPGKIYVITKPKEKKHDLEEGMVGGTPV